MILHTDSNGWETDYDAKYNVTEDVSITLKPYIDFTVEFACKLFGGLIDLSSGIKAEPSFPFVTTATATQSINETGAVSYPNSTSSSTCANGLSEDINFEFDVTAFATKWVDITLYVSILSSLLYDWDRGRPTIYIKEHRSNRETGIQSRYLGRLSQLLRQASLK